MPKNEEIQICFEEGELVDKYLKSLENGGKPKEPLSLYVDSDGDNDDDIKDLEAISAKAYIYCDSCRLNIVNFCPKCGSLDISTKTSRFMCSYCYYSFNQKYMLREHKKMCENSNSTLSKSVRLPRFIDKHEFVSCPFCKKRQNKSCLYHHLKKCAEKNTGSTSHQKPVSISYNQREIIDTDFVCSECTMRFTDVHNFRQHMNAHSTQKIKSTTSSNTSNNKVPIPSLHSAKKYPKVAEFQKLNLSVDPKCAYSIFIPDLVNAECYTTNRTKTGANHKADETNGTSQKADQTNSASHKADTTNVTNQKGDKANGPRTYAGFKMKDKLFRSIRPKPMDVSVNKSSQ